MTDSEEFLNSAQQLDLIGWTADHLIESARAGEMVGVHNAVMTLTKKDARAVVNALLSRLVVRPRLESANDLALDARHDTFPEAQHPAYEAGWLEGFERGYASGWDADPKVP
jgi:hypothetical protein